MSSIAMATQGLIEVNEGYVRESIPGTSISSAYMLIQNSTKERVKLIGAESAVSDKIEIHEHIMENDMMKMVKRESLTISANQAVKLQPSGYHLMVFDLKKPLSAGEEIAITLIFSNQSRVTVNLPVKGKKQKASHHHH